MISAASTVASNHLETSQEWDLSDLYQDFDDPQIASDLADLQQQAADFRDRPLDAG